MLPAQTSHVLADVIYYLAFVAGQGLFVLKRAAMAIRSKTNPIATRRAFLYTNWDVLLIRAALEMPVFWIWRHKALGSVAAFLGLAIPDKFSLPVNPLVAVMLGYMADSLLDWASTSSKVPSIIRENIPRSEGESIT